MSEKMQKKMGFEEFRKLASNGNLSMYQRIGFPDSYRSGYEELIFSDICRKITNLNFQDRLVLDIGCGCSDLPRILMDYCKTANHRLYLIDSSEMLDLLPSSAGVSKLAAQFPACDEFIQDFQGKFDCVLVYSVLQYAFIENTFFKFIDSALSLLAPGGQMLLGDIPNISKRKRFFASKNGIDFHKKFMNTNLPPEVNFYSIESHEIDDSVIYCILSRARSQGFNAYVLPQDDELPMANRREDILIARP